MRSERRRQALPVDAFSVILSVPLLSPRGGQRSWCGLTGIRLVLVER